jgi:hypothetical protein
MDRAVHMALCREVDHSARPVLHQEITHALTVGDIRLDKDMAGITLKARQVFQVAGVGQFVEIDHWLAPQASQSRTKLAPINPAPPVTRIMGNVLAQNHPPAEER